MEKVSTALYGIDERGTHEVTLEDVVKASDRAGGGVLDASDDLVKAGVELEKERLKTGEESKLALLVVGLRVGAGRGQLP